MLTFSSQKNEKRLAKSAGSASFLHDAKSLFLLAGAWPRRSDAHRGRTDKNGCHVDKKTGIRHCH
ncbi:MAG: YHYH domain-containing protein [Spirochaetales bacterium]|nr:YHYH domain-containing protein [Spirochaetales bacterium]